MFVGHICSSDKDRQFQHDSSSIYIRNAPLHFERTTGTQKKSLLIVFLRCSLSTKLYLARGALGIEASMFFSRKIPSAVPSK